MPPRPDSADLAPEEGPLQLRFSTWSIVRAVLIVVAGIAIVGVVGAASTALWWLAIAATLAGLFQPAVIWLKNYMPTWLAIVVVILGVSAIVGLVGYRGYAEMNSQFEILRANAVESAQDIQSSAQFGQVASEFGLVEKTKSFFDNLPVVFGGSSDKAAETVQSAASSGSSIFAIVTFALLLLIFGPRLVRGALDQIDDESVRRRISGLVVESYRRSSRYVWLMAVRALVVGIIGGIVCKAIGLQTPTALGVAFAILSLVPGLGIVIAALPVAVSVAITSVPTAVALVVVAVVLQGLDVVFVQRRIDDSSVHVGPSASLVAALVGLQLYGLGGVMVAVAFTVYGMAVFRALTSTHDEVLSAVRSLVGDEAVEDLEEGDSGEPRESATSAEPASEGSESAEQRDEAQAVLGVARASAERGGELDGLLVRLERDLWVLMAELATDPSNRAKLTPGQNLVTAEMATALEALIDDLSARFHPPTEFVVPGENQTAAYLDLARTIVRRSERDAIRALGDHAAEGHCVVYLNRLSDLLWTMARWQEGVSRPARTDPNEQPSGATDGN